MKNNKTILLTSLISVVAVAVLGVSLFFILSPSSSAGSGEITISLEKLNEEQTSTTMVEQKKIEFHEDETFRNLLEQNFECEFDSGMLMSIGPLTTPADWSYYIAFYVNDEYSQVGVEQYGMVDGDSIVFREELIVY